MLDLPQLPELLYAERDKVIESACTGKACPEALIKIQQWLENDGWDALVGNLSNETMALDLPQLADGSFNDGEYIDGWLGDDIPITNEMRIAHARMLISQTTVSDDGYLCPSIYSYPLQNESGNTAVIGCVMPMLGQSGPQTNWWGVYKSHENFLEALKNNNLVPFEMLDNLSDKELLSFWDQRDIKTTP